tara:strand:+ start:318 stop:1184 length:867 start_codon:yes stop_codon:yes gene_type:complete
MSEYQDKMQKLRAELPQGSTIEKRSKADQAKFKRMESSVAYPTSDAATGVTEKPGDLGEVAYPQTDPMYGEEALLNKLAGSTKGNKSITQPAQKTKASSEKPERSNYYDFSEWEKRQPGYGKPKRREPTLEERGIDVGGALPGAAPTLAERVEAYKKAVEENYSSDEVIGIGPDGKPRYQRGTSTGDGFGGEPPENVDGATDKAMDIYRKAAKNYPKDAPIDVQQGFAVAASTQDYNSQGYSSEEPKKSTVVQFDGRVGEQRDYDDGSSFFVSADGKIILRLDDEDKK